MAHECFITIDNSQNPCDLTLLAVSEVQGTPSIELIPNETIVAANSSTPLSFSILGGDIASASITLVWSTGSASFNTQTIVTMQAQNKLFGDNSASLSFAPSTENAEDALLTYGVSYYQASSGADSPMGRNFVNETSGGDSPVYVNFSMVSNKYVINPPATPFLPGITNVVMLMLENRSFDHLLGMLYTQNPVNIYPANSQVPTYGPTITNPINFDGLFNFAAPGFTNPNGNTGNIAANPVQNAMDVPNPDPGEGWANTNTQLFNSSATSGNPNMQGFINDYVDTNGSSSDPNQIMQYYTPDSLPVMSALAQHYAVSDAWFASVPSQTSPNRAFSLCATSDGYVNNTKDGQPSTDPFEMVRFKPNTIFNTLSDCGLGDDWAIYYQDTYETGGGFCLTTMLFEQLFSYSTSSNVKPFSSNNKKTSTFMSDLKNGTLPAFSYLEPAWYTGIKIGSQEPQNGNDYHPPANLCPGEQNLAAVYEALTNYKDWNSTLLIVTFDEHGGIFDHVPPPATVPPDGLTDWSSFGFDRLGLRIPTLLISPMIKNGTVFRSPADVPFDHTSFVRTILGWQNIDVSDGVMGKRAAQAPDFSGVLSTTALNTPPLTFAVNCSTSSGSEPLNELQKLYLPFLAQSLSGAEYGSDEHHKVLTELKTLKNHGELKDYIKKKTATR